MVNQQYLFCRFCDIVTQGGSDVLQIVEGPNKELCALNFPPENFPPAANAAMEMDVRKIDVVSPSGNVSDLFFLLEKLVRQCVLKLDSLCDGFRRKYKN